MDLGFGTKRVCHCTLANSNALQCPTIIFPLRIKKKSFSSYFIPTIATLVDLIIRTGRKRFRLELFKKDRPEFSESSEFWPFQRELVWAVQYRKHTM